MRQLAGAVLWLFPLSVYLLKVHEFMVPTSIVPWATKRFAANTDMCPYRFLSLGN